MWFLDLLNRDSERPTAFSSFHIIFIIFFILLTFALIYVLKDRNEKRFRIIVFIFWIIIVILEILKQILFSYCPGEEPLFQFLWYSFPFQFCSSPIYLLPFVVFCKDGKVRDSVLSFLVTFSLFAGFAVAFIYPTTCFIGNLFINHQTLIHHGSQFVIGVLIAYMYKDKLDLKFLFKGCITFAIMSAIALILDVVIYQFISSDQTFNMFYISPYYPSTLPLLDIIYEKVPYVIFLIIYLLGFSFVALIMYIIEKFVIHLFNLKKNVKK